MFFRKRSYIALLSCSFLSFSLHAMEEETDKHRIPITFTTLNEDDIRENLSQHLRVIDCPLKREKIVALFASGASNYSDLSPVYLKRFVPVLAQLPIEEISEIQQYFSSEVIQVAKEKKIFLPLLDRLVRRIHSRAIKENRNLPNGRIKLINDYVACSREERLQMMSTLTPDRLRQCPTGNFFVLDEELYAQNNAFKGLSETLVSMIWESRPATIIEIMCQTPIRWYPLFRLALTCTESEFNTLFKSYSNVFELKKMSNDDLLLAQEEFPTDCGYEKDVAEVTRFIGYIGCPMSEQQYLQVAALIYYEPTEHALPRLRSPSEVQALVRYLQDLKREKLSAADYLHHLSIVPSPLVKNAFWTDVAAHLAPRLMEAFKRRPSEDLEAIEKFFTPEKKSLAVENGIYYQIIDRFAGHTANSFVSTTPDEQKALMTLLTDEFIRLCPKGKFAELARIMREMTLPKANQVLSLLRERVLEKFDFITIVKSVFIIPGKYPPSTVGMIFPTDEDRARILSCLTDEFFTFCPDLTYFHMTLRTLYYTPTPTHTFVIKFLLNGFSHEWVERIIGFGSYDSTPKLVSKSKTYTGDKKFTFKRLLPCDYEQGDNKRLKEEDRMSLINFLMRLNRFGFKTQGEIEAILVHIASPFLGDEKHHQEVTRNVLEFLNDDLLKILQNTANLTRFIRLIYGEPDPYLELKPRLNEEIEDFLTFLSPDKLSAYTTPEELLKCVKNLRYAKEERTFKPATSGQKPDLSNEFTRIMLENNPDKWFFED